MARIKDLIPDPPVRYSVTAEASVLEAAQLMGQHNVGIVMVFAGEKLVGVFSERDMIRRVIAKGKAMETTKINEVMSKEVLCATVDERPDDCLKKMEKQDCRHIPIMSGDKVVAMLSIRDLMRHVLREKETDLKMLEDYVAAP